jgi:hypothetical protein
MTDVVYIFGPGGSKWGDRELFYSLRSVGRHLKNFGQIFVLGSFPAFARSPGIPFKHLLSSDPYRNKQHNQRKKMLELCVNPEISESFLLMNDDFFICRDVDAVTIPAYRQGTIAMHIDWRKENPSTYLNSLVNTARALERSKLPDLDFELHVPMPMRRDALKRVLEDFTFDWSVRDGLCARSLYGNSLNLPGVRLMDLKLDSPLTESELLGKISDKPFFSAGPGGCNPAMASALEKLFPTF